MAVSMRDLDSAFQGAGQKAYPYNNFFNLRLLEYILHRSYAIADSMYELFFRASSLHTMGKLWCPACLLDSEASHNFFSSNNKS